MDEPSWEHMKENVMPLKRGRSVKVLNEALKNKEEPERKTIEK